MKLESETSIKYVVPFYLFFLLKENFFLTEPLRKWRKMWICFLYFYNAYTYYNAVEFKFRIFFFWKWFTSLSRKRIMLHYVFIVTLFYVCCYKYDIICKTEVFHESVIHIYSPFFSIHFLQEKPTTTTWNCASTTKRRVI